MGDGPQSNSQKHYYEFGHDAAAEWLRDPGPFESGSFGFDDDQDFDITFPGMLDRELIGHLRFYHQESIPNPEKKDFLLNCVYFLTWQNYGGLFRGPAWYKFVFRPQEIELSDRLEEAVCFAKDSGNPELVRWASDVLEAARKGRSLKYGFWCNGGWSKL